MMSDLVIMALMSVLNSVRENIHHLSQNNNIRICLSNLHTIEASQRESGFRNSRQLSCYMQAVCLLQKRDEPEYGKKSSSLDY